ncbi:hypothetical protein EV182_005100, partial [Spiromyces aspiralis]
MPGPNQPGSIDDDFISQVALRISNAANVSNSVILAKSIVNFGWNESDFARFSAKCRALGRFDNEFLKSLYADILSHARGSTDGDRRPDSSHIPLLGRDGGSNGFQKGDALDNWANRGDNGVKNEQEDEEEIGGLILQSSKKSSIEQRHAFKAPKPRTSLLGLDKLAAEKRSALEKLKKVDLDKRISHDNDDDG